MNKILISLFVSGVLFGSTLCMASCGPVLISYIAGTGKSVLKGLLAYAVFSFSRVSVYLVLGLLIYFLGKFTVERIFAGGERYIIVIGGIFIVFIGLLLASGKHFEFPQLHWLQKKLLQQDKKSLMVLGVCMGILPCAPLFALLSYVGLISKTWVESVLYAFSFGIGTAFSPLLLLVLASGLINKFFINGKGICRNIFNIACGLVIIFFGIHLLLGQFY